MPKYIKTVMAASILALACLTYVWQAYLDNGREISEQAIKTAELAESTFPKDAIDRLEADANDVSRQDYWNIKKSLADMVAIDENIRFAYVYVRQNGKLFFLADSEPADSPDYSPPGQEYAEADPQYYLPYEAEKSIITDKVSDRWGEWVSILVPMHSHASGEMVGVFALDYPADHWEDRVWRETLGDASLALALLAILASFWVVVRNSRKFRKSENNFRNFFSAVGDMAFVGDVKGGIKYANRSVEDRLGYSSEELRKMNILDVHRPGDRKEAERVFTDMLSGKRAVCPLPLSAKDGQVIPVETRIWFGDWDGERSIFGISKDLTIEQEALQKFNKIFESNPALMAVSEIANRRFIEVNNAFLGKLGYKKDDVIGKTPDDLNLFVEPEKQAQVAQELKKRGSLANIELKVRTKRGDILDGVFYGEVIENQGRKFFLMVMIEITDRLRAEARVKRALEYQKFLAKISTDLNQYDDFNAAMEHVLEKIAMHSQVSRSYIFEDSYDGKTTSNTFEWCAEGVEPQIDNLQNIPYEQIPSFIRGLSKNGEFKTDDVSKLPKDVRDILEPQQIKSILILPLSDKDRIFGFVGFDQVDRKRAWEDIEIDLLKTITASISGVFERKRKTEEIQRESDKIEAIVRGIGDAVFVVDKEMRMILFNPVAAKLSGYSEDEALGKEYGQILKFVFESDPSVVNDKFIKQAMGTGKAQSMSNHTLLVAKSGKKIPVADSASPLKNKAGEITGCVVVFRDATIEREIDKMKSEFVSVASHQLKTPLTGIKWMSELLLREDLNEQQMDFARDVHKSSERLTKLIDDLLDVSHIETGRKFEIVKKKTDIIKVIDEALANNGQLAKERGVFITRCKNASKSIFVNLDRDKIMHVFDNLINNAIKYSSRKNGKVEIACHDENKDEIMFEIKDNGIGIPGEQQNRVFEKFFRADNAAQSETDGTGLGLYIAKSIVEAHGGRVWFISREGAGSSFFVKFNI